MERPQLEEHVCPREVELQKALPNAFIRIWNLCFPGPLRADSSDDSRDLLLL